jgi:hypothetical protein
MYWRKGLEKSTGEGAGQDQGKRDLRTSTRKELEEEELENQTKEYRKQR